MTGGFFRDFIWRLEFSGYAAARFLLRRMSFDQASACGAWAIRPFAKFFPARDRVARTNMKLAFPEASADEVEAWLAANEIARRALVAPMIDPIISRIFITDARVGNEGDTQCA